MPKKHGATASLIGAVPENIESEGSHTFNTRRAQSGGAQVDCAQPSHNHLQPRCPNPSRIVPSVRHETHYRPRQPQTLSSYHDGRGLSYRYPRALGLLSGPSSSSTVLPLLLGNLMTPRREPLRC